VGSDKLPTITGARVEIMKFRVCEAARVSAENEMVSVAAIAGLPPA
jgi:hypothetical protein